MLLPLLFSAEFVLEGEVGQGSELRRDNMGPQMFQGLKVRLSSVGEEGLEGVGPGTRSEVRGEEPPPVAEGNGLRAASALVDQMELP